MTTSDDGVREIQLSGKQLVFLFMAVTVVSVVIFLCGVLVGRGVQARSVLGEVTAAQEPDPEADDASPPGATTPAGPTKADNLGYPQRLQSAGTPPEMLVTQPEPRRTPPVSAAPASAAAATTAPASPPAAASPGAPAATAAPRSGPANRSSEPTTPQPGPADSATPASEAKAIPPEPKGDGVAIQVAALRGRTEAEGVVARLKGKGYAAYLMPPLAGQPAVFRVRVGKFKTRAEAEKVAARLEREEQFKPWITR